MSREPATADRAAARKRPAAEPPATAEQRVARDAPPTRDRPRPKPGTKRQRQTQPTAGGTKSGRMTSARTTGLAVEVRMGGLLVHETAGLAESRVSAWVAYDQPFQGAN